MRLLEEHNYANQGIYQGEPQGPPHCKMLEKNDCISMNNISYTCARVITVTKPNCLLLLATDQYP